MNFNHNHGGNPKGVSDCVARALAITLQRPYYEVAAALAPFMQEGGVDIGSIAFHWHMLDMDFHYVAVTSRLKVCELPANCIAHTLNHWTAIVDGCVQDTIDTRMEMVRGYWVRGDLFNVVKAGKVVNSAPLSFAAAINMRRLLALNYSNYTEIEPCK